jgi:hypothetical protein
MDLETQGNFCGRCGQLTLSADVPRQVRLKQSFGVASKIVLACMLYAAICVSFLYFIVGPLAVRRYGTGTSAVVQCVAIVPQGRGFTYAMTLDYTDGRGNAQTGRAPATREEYLAQPVGTRVPIRYFRGYPTVGRPGTVDAFDEWLSWFFLVLALFLPWAVLRQLGVRKRLLSLGTVHEAVVNDVVGHNTRVIEVEYGQAVKTSRKFVFRGGKQPKLGSKLWIVEDGTEKGIAILDQAYEWECVHPMR